MINKNKKPKRSSNNKDQPDKPTTQVGDATQKAKEETSDKVTVLNLKDGFLIDYSKPDNVHNKLQEIKED